jgi:hypothetical protein
VGGACSTGLKKRIIERIISTLTIEVALMTEKAGEYRR